MPRTTTPRDERPATPPVASLAISDPLVISGLGRRSPGPTRARLEVRHVPVWPVLRLALVASLGTIGAFTGAVAVLWSVAESAGLVAEAESFVASLLGVESFTIRSGALLTGLALVSIVLAALMTLAAVLATVAYNLLASLGGGIEVDVHQGTAEHETIALRPRRDGSIDGDGQRPASGKDRAAGAAADDHRASA